jgi:anthranilate synthase
MGVRHRELPIEAVQFHPESILTLTPGANYGLKIIENAVKLGKTAGNANLPIGARP